MNGILCLVDKSVNHRETTPVSDLGVDIEGSSTLKGDLDALKTAIEGGLKSYPLGLGVAMETKIVVDKKCWVGKLTKQHNPRFGNDNTLHCVGNSRFFSIKNFITFDMETGVNSVRLDVKSLSSDKQMTLNIYKEDLIDLESKLDNLLADYVEETVKVTLHLNFDAKKSRVLSNETMYAIKSFPKEKGGTVYEVALFNSLDKALEEIQSDKYIKEIEKGVIDTFAIVVRHKEGKLTVGKLWRLDRKKWNKGYEGDRFVVAHGERKKVEISRRLYREKLNKMVHISVTGLYSGETFETEGLVTCKDGVVFVGDFDLREIGNKVSSDKVLVVTV